MMFSTSSIKSYPRLSMLTLFDDLIELLRPCNSGASSLISSITGNAESLGLRILL